ncbi:MAG: 3-hydroxyacyl-ACP dehydratase FabZ [Candidatus Sericytochromatia bacterium]|nr:3-hydroxyacyl-ACP dehydratase FabZ [Candidatus Sericytochromatia bacterium]
MNPAPQSTERILELPLDSQAIQALLPHRYPFLLLDRVLSLEPGVRASGVKNVSHSDPWFAGHFPHRPIMPGVLIVEAMAQLGGVLLMAMQPADAPQKLAMLTGVDGMRFRRQVVPGDQLLLEAELLKTRGQMGKIAARAKVVQQLVSEGELLFYLADDSADTC